MESLCSVFLYGWKFIKIGNAIKIFSQEKLKVLRGNYFSKSIAFLNFSHFSHFKI